MSERGWLTRRVFPAGREPDPRFTLANERTFLAWIRTALGLLAGGIGVLTLGMMARTARGHTGRPLEATRLMTAAFTIINLAALVRVFGPIAAPEFQAPVIGLSGLLWATAFVLFLVEYVPVLLGPRVDGRPG